MKFKSRFILTIVVFSTLILSGLESKRAEAQYPQFERYPESYKQLSIADEEFTKFDLLLESCQASEELKIDSLRKISNFFTALFLKEMMWNVKNASEDELALDADDPLSMDPVYYQRMSEHRIELLNRLLGERRMTAVRSILERGLESKDADVKEFCFRLALSKLPKREYLDKTLQYMRDDDLTARQFLHLLDLLSKVVYEPAIKLIERLQQTDKRAFAYTTKALMRYGIPPDRAKIRELVRNDWASPSVHALYVLSVLPEKEDVDLLIDALVHSETVYAKEKCIDALNGNLKRMSGEQIERFSDGVYEALLNDPQNLLHAASKTVFLLAKRDGGSSTKALALALLRSLNKRYAARYKNNYRRILLFAEKEEFPESLPPLIDLLSKNISDESNRIILDAVERNRPAMKSSNGLIGNRLKTPT